MRIKEVFYEIESKNLPESFNFFRIAHLSDLHDEAPDEILDILNRHSPDIICFTGDAVDGNKSHIDKMAEYLEKLSKIAPLYFVSGNHDKKSPEFLSLIENDKNIRFLDGKSDVLERNGEKITIRGLGDPYSKRPDVAKERLLKELEKTETSQGFSVLLYHRASHFDIIADKGFSLVLSGHMHGGQIIIPRLGGLLPPKSSLFDTGRVFFPKFAGGLYENGNTKMVVSRGVGNQIIIPRINNPAEIGIITLKKADC